MKPLTPPDPRRCQVETRPPWSPFNLGPRPGYQRCTNVPAHIAREREPDEHGRFGAMSVCESCLPNLPKEIDAVVEPITAFE